MEGLEMHDCKEREMGKIIPYVLQTQEWGLSATEERRNKSQNSGGKSRKVNADFGNQEFCCQQRKEGT